MSNDGKINVNTKRLFLPSALPKTGNFEMFSQHNPIFPIREIYKTPHCTEKRNCQEKPTDLASFHYPVKHTITSSYRRSESYKKNDPIV